jgi:formylglycine-generating enzyme required for sulfatase activity
MQGSDNSDDIARAVARAQRPVLLLVFMLVLIMSLPWVGAGYCAYAGGPFCPPVLSPKKDGGSAKDTNGQTRSDSKPRDQATGKDTPTGPGGTSPTIPSPSGANPKWVALVIGNSQYRAPNALANPRNDASDMAVALQRLGYTLVRDEARGTPAWFDTEYDRLDEAMRRFAAQAADADVALIYYAGHGLEENGTNYLIPVDARLDRDVDLANEGYTFDVVTRRLPRYGISVVIVDACRTPRFPLADRTGTTRALEGQRGFQVVEAPDRALFAFSAGPNQRASDGRPTDRNSPYTRDLLKAMEEPDVLIENVFKTVRQRFIDRGDSQKPEFRDNLGRPNLAFAPPEPPKKPGERFRDCPECPEMVVLPAGRFRMGAAAGDAGASDDERPQRTVSLPKDFAVGRFEVTFAEWDACVRGGGCNGYRPDDRGWGRERQPVINVSWLDAQAYVQWLNSLPTKGRGKYRLMSEAEWEYAARAGTSTAYPWGEAASHDFANYGAEECCSGLAFGRDMWEFTAPIESFPANAFGLHDMQGNVWEWTEDCWNGSYADAPTDGSAWRQGDCNYRVLRGGSWSSYSLYLRSAFRYRFDTSVRVNFFGFRVARAT